METRFRKTTLQDRACDVTDFAKQRALYVECNSPIEKAIRTHKTIRAALATAPHGSEARANLLHNEGYALRAVTLCHRRSEAGTRRLLAYLRTVRAATVEIIMRAHIEGAIAACVVDLSFSAGQRHSERVRVAA